MLDALRKPLQPSTFAALVIATAVAVAVYCLGYTWLSGHPESVGEALGWALVNVAPWIAAVEFGKRADSGGAALVIAAGAALMSIALGYAFDISGGGLLFEFWRRVPPLLAGLALIALLRSPIGGRHRSADIPLLPRQIDWVRAAGNYVELRASDRTVIHRAPLSAIEQQLADHGFIRIHRSLLVQRDRIARIRPEDVVLVDGTHLKIGKRYRAAFAA